MQEFPHKWGKYILLDHIDSGGMAEIYLALPFDPSKRQRLMIIKRIRRSHEAKNDLLRMFRIETQALLSLDSPYIVQTYDTSSDDDTEPFLVMEYIEGLSIRRAKDALSVRGTSKFTLEISLEVARHVFLALSAAHENQNQITGERNVILHRDISPHNIVFSSSGYVKVIDFGVAKFEAFDSATLFTGQIKGKLNYMSPEQFIGKDKLDARSDIFSVGVVLWEMISGERFFKTQEIHEEFLMEKFIKGTFQPDKLSAYNDTVGEELESFIGRLLAVSKDGRVSSSSEAASWIAAFQIKNNLPSGPDFIKQFISENFNEVIALERHRIRQLIEKTQNLTDFEIIEEATVVTGDRAAAFKSYIPSMLGVALFLLVIGAYLFSTKSAIPPIAVAPSAARRTVASGSGLSDAERKIVRRIFNWSRALPETASPAVYDAWKSAYQLDEKTARPKPAMNQFTALDDAERSNILNNIELFIEQFTAAQSDEEKIKLIEKNKEQIRVLPPSRKQQRN